jgi:hypothetical protein
LFVCKFLETEPQIKKSPFLLPATPCTVVVDMMMMIRKGGVLLLLLLLLLLSYDEQARTTPPVYIANLDRQHDFDLLGGATA